MITALSIQYPAKTKGLGSFLNRFRRDSVGVSVKSARGVALRHVTYTSFSGEVRLDRLRDPIGTDRGEVVCSDRIVFPHRSGFTRFSSNAFSARLCENLALAALALLEAPETVKLGIFDPEGQATEFMLSSLSFCREPVIVSENALAYSIAAKRALEERGAAVSFESSPLALSDCDLIVAPFRLKKPLNIKDRAVVLCTGSPDISENVYGKYSFRMPNGFDQIKPRELGEEYFCSALYSLAAQHELGSIVPLSVSNSRRTQTAASIAQVLAKKTG